MLRLLSASFPLIAVACLLCAAAPPHAEQGSTAFEQAQLITDRIRAGRLADALDASSYTIVSISSVPVIMEGWLVTPADASPFTYDDGPLPPASYFNDSPFTVTLRIGDSLVSFPPASLLVVVEESLPPDVTCRENYSACCNRDSARCVRDSDFRGTHPPTCENGGLGASSCQRPRN
jgi:hypothetical protein